MEIKINNTYNKFDLTGTHSSDVILGEARKSASVNPSEQAAMPMGSVEDSVVPEITSTTVGEVALTGATVLPPRFRDDDEQSPEITAPSEIIRSVENKNDLVNSVQEIFGPYIEAANRKVPPSANTKLKSTFGRSRVGKKDTIEWTSTPPEPAMPTKQGEQYYDKDGRVVPIGAYYAQLKSQQKTEYSVDYTVGEYGNTLSSLRTVTINPENKEKKTAELELSPDSLISKISLGRADQYQEDEPLFSLFRGKIASFASIKGIQVGIDASGVKLEVRGRYNIHGDRPRFSGIYTFDANMQTFLLQDEESRRYDNVLSGTLSSENFLKALQLLSKECLPAIDGENQ